MMRVLNISILVFWLLIVIVSGYMISQTRFSADFSAFLPDQATHEDRLLVEQIKKGSALRTFLLAIEGGSLEDRVKTSHELTDVLSKTQRFMSVRNGNQQQSNHVLQFIVAYRYLLSDRLSEQSFSSSHLHQAIEQSIQRLTTDAGAVLKPYFLADPTAETLYILKQLVGEKSIHQAGSAWASVDEKQLLLVVESKYSGSDLDALEAEYALINDEFLSLVAQSGHADLRLTVAGAPISALNSRRVIKSEIETLSIVSSVLIMTLLLFFYRSIRLLIIGLLPIVTGIIVATAVVGFTFDVVYTITLGFGIALIGEGVDYAIYYFMQSQPQQYNDVQQKAFWSTIRLGVLTSLAGFLTLLGSSFPGLVQIGIFAMTGILVAALVTRFMLPIIAADSKPRYTLSLYLPVLWLIQYRQLMHYGIGVLLLIAISVIFYHQDNMLNKNLNALNTASLAEKTIEKQIKSALSVPDMRFLWVVRDDTQEGVLRRTEQLLQRIIAQDTTSNIASIQSPTRIMPSIDTQQKRMSYLPEQQAFIAVLNDALSGLPLKVGRLEPFTDALEHTKNMQLISREMIYSAGLSFMLDSLLYQTDSEWVAILPLVYKDALAVNQSSLDALVNEFGHDHVVYLDMLKKSNQLYQHYLDEVISFSLLGLLVVVILIVAVLRSVRRLYRVVMPLMVSIILIVALLLAMGERISLFHIIGFLLVFAIGSNYALFFESLKHDALTQVSVMSSLILANVTTVIAFGSLAFSQLLVLHALGVTVALGAFLSLILSALFSKTNLLKVSA